MIPLQPQNEEKTLVYVLVKKPEEAPEVHIPTPAPTQPSKPEVYFIRYKTQVRILKKNNPKMLLYPNCGYNRGRYNLILLNLESLLHYILLLNAFCAFRNKKATQTVAYLLPSTGLPPLKLQRPLASTEHRPAVRVLTNRSGSRESNTFASTVMFIILVACNLRICNLRMHLL